MSEDKDKIIAELKERIEILERKQKFSFYVYPYNAFISGESITFCYDPDQRKELGKDDKMVFELKSIPMSKYIKFIKSNTIELGLHAWVCGEQGGGYFENTPDKELYNECFNVRLSECLHRMIESDNDLKLHLLKRERNTYHERNR